LNYFNQDIIDFIHIHHLKLSDDQKKIFFISLMNHIYINENTLINWGYLETLIESFKGNEEVLMYVQSKSKTFIKKMYYYLANNHLLLKNDDLKKRKIIGFIKQFMEEEDDLNLIFEE
jgi:hypothetical protein